MRKLGPIWDLSRLGGEVSGKPAATVATTRKVEKKSRQGEGRLEDSISGFVIFVLFLFSPAIIEILGLRLERSHALLDITLVVCTHELSIPDMSCLDLSN